MSTTLINRYILWKMGYFRDQKGILNRYQNELSNWNPHLSNTRTYIMDTVKDKSPENIAILGSGWMLDVPIDELINISKSITLFDIIHPSKIINKYKRYENIKFIDVDLTGGIVEQVYKQLNINKVKRSGFVYDLHHQSIDLNKFDLVISVNILNQLDILLKENIISKIEVTKEDIEFLSTLIQSFHIRTLPIGKSCLISDYEELLIDKCGKQVGKNNLIFTDLPEGKNRKTWQWIFDTNQKYYKDINVTFNVEALTF